MNWFVVGSTVWPASPGKGEGCKRDELTNMFQGGYRAATHKLSHRDDATLGEISVRCVASVVAQCEPFQAKRANPGDAVLQKYSN